MDFSSLKGTSGHKRPLDPIKIFEALPSLPSTFNDLWRGQASALEKWHASREKSDVHVALNTGAGKTVVGLLIAQSLVNEGLQNVLYLCSTLDLVKQTSEEATKIGIAHTCRVRKDFTNDIFESGRGFCITTYQAVLNGHSAIRAKHFPQAIIFDDAHVADSLLRDAFTLQIDERKHRELFNEIVALFRPHFESLGQTGRFRRSISPSENSTIMVSPGGLYERQSQLIGAFLKHQVDKDSDLTFPFAWLEDHLHAYAATFSRGIFELTPPFLPSRALDIFSRAVKRRVYLSATLESQTEFIRAFGRRPDVVITPENDAGNGERLILNGRNVVSGFNPKFVKGLATSRKVVVAVPSYKHANNWAEVANAPTTETFSSELDQFRAKKGGATFLLVSRVDGIDLPHDTCRIMVLEGLPAGTTQLERFQWEYLRMIGVQSARIASRVAQLFGRINRGRNDYGAFLIEGDDLNKWLGNDRNLALLPPLLQKQIVVGRTVQEGLEIKNQDDAVMLVDKVLGRDVGWLDYYQQEVKLAELDQDQLERHFANEPQLVDAALSEAKYAASIWNRDFAAARSALEETVDTTTNHDTFLAGWHALWLGATFELEGDPEAALPFYGQALSRLGDGITLPRPKNIAGKKEIDFNSFGASLYRLVHWTHASKFESEFEKVRTKLDWINDGSPNKSEEGIRTLGEILGFSSSRPDNDEGTGPDVLWKDESQPRQIGFELKTDKSSSSSYSKADINQGLGHLEWMKSNFPEHTILGLTFVGPILKPDKKASPSANLTQVDVVQFVHLKEKLVSLVLDIRKRTPMERVIEISRISEHSDWDLESILSALGPTALTKDS